MFTTAYRSFRGKCAISMIAFLWAWGCSSDDDLGFGDLPDAGVDATDSVDSGAGGSGGGTGGCKTAADCDDGIACTVDVCVKGACSHYAGPNTGATACPAGQYCEVDRGCVPGVVCATDAQCEERFGDDPCKADIRCDSAQAICVFSPLDRDNDGHVPIACGGDDCNDADDSVYPGNVDICDNKDNDCDGVIDNASESLCSGAEVCQGGQCICPAANQCGAACVDKATDRDHCGECNKACPAGEACENGICTCPATSIICDGACVDPDTSVQHCGGCKKSCERGQVCEQGKCKDVPCTAPAMYLLVDVSASMQGPKWTATKDGITAFVGQSASAGIESGLGFFPTATSACLASSYMTPNVALAPLSTNASDITTSLARTPNESNSYLTAPLQGSLDHLREWAVTNPSSKAAVVVLFDGKPNASHCSPTDSWTAAVSAAATGSSGTPPVQTFAIGIGTDLAQADVDELASAGGTGTGYVATTATQVTAALEAIRGKLLSCP